ELTPIQVNREQVLVYGIDTVAAAKKLQQNSLIVEVEEEPYRGSGRREAIMIPIDQLKDHPLNPSIYGEDESVTNLVEAIQESRRIDTLMVCPDPQDGKYLILSDHRQRKVGEILGLTELPCEIIEPKNEVEEIQIFISLNTNRELSIEQKARAGIELEKVKKQEARKRQGQKGKGEGAVRDWIAKFVKLGSGVNYEKAKACVLAMDAGHPKAKEIKAKLSGVRGVEQAYKLLNCTSPTPKPTPEELAQTAWENFTHSYHAGYQPFDEAYIKYEQDYSLDQHTEELVRTAIQYGIWLAQKEKKKK
ncbi:MAG TPA: ParB/RepB/Spo0J family partition protein, partial [Nostocaceae cyanobacterium]|nr:ParB/RepB/Spo0J family partition protein [Nostocaceae cyanobacterium]